MKIIFILIILLTGIYFLFSKKNNTTKKVETITKPAKNEVDIHIKKPQIKKNQISNIILKKTILKDQKVISGEFTKIQYGKFNIETSFETSNYFDTFLEAYEKKDYKKVLEFGENLLKIPDRYCVTWWYGNAIHSVNIVIARTYYETGDLEQAKKYLLNSVSTKYVNKSLDKMYSPQLSTFGPDLSLAYDFYKKGHSEVAIEYLKATKLFWVFEKENGGIDKAINNILNAKENIYEEQDNIDYPFKRKQFHYRYIKFKN